MDQLLVRVSCRHFEIGRILQLKSEILDWTA
jgi:hypothetical protein